MDYLIATWEPKDVTIGSYMKGESYNSIINYIVENSNYDIRYQDVDIIVNKYMHNTIECLKNETNFIEVVKLIKS